MRLGGVYCGLMTLFLWQCRPATAWQRESGDVFGTRFHLVYQADESLLPDVRTGLRQLDSELSLFNPNSTLARINRNETDTVTPLFARVFCRAQAVAAATGGCFDATVAPLVHLWGFGTQAPAEVSNRQVDSTLLFVGYAKVRLAGNRLVKEDARLQLDFGAIAKGFATDRVAALLAAKGVQNYMVEIGGEIVTCGVNSRGEAWEIGIVKPTQDADTEELQTILTVHRTAMATSGNYRNGYVRNGKRYAHTLHPHTGRPTETDLLSVTVFAADCATADAYATAFMVMGLQKTRAFLSQHPELSVYLISSDRRTGTNGVWIGRKP